MNEVSRECKGRFYADLMAYVQGKPNGIKPGTVGEAEAALAKELVQDNLTLLLPEYKDVLLEWIESSARSVDVRSRSVEFDRELDVPF